MKQKAYELYVLPDYVKRAGIADQAFWMKDAVLILLVIGLSLLDAVTLFTVFDTVMYQSQALGILLTVGCAISLNFIPLVMARFIHHYRYRMGGVKLWMIIAMGVVFLLLLSATFYLRWETRELSFSGMESGMVDTTGQAAGLEETDSNSKEAIAVTLLLGILPGITSAINLALGYFNDDPVKRKLQELTHERHKLANQLNIMKAAHDELDQDWENRLSKLDAERFAMACESVHNTTNQICALARLELAKKLRDPESINALTEPKLTEETIQTAIPKTDGLAKAV